MNWKFWKKKKKQFKDEEIIRLVGALTIMEIKNSRSFRRKIEKTAYGRKVNQLIHY